MRHNFQVCWAYFQTSRYYRIKNVFIEGTYSLSRILHVLKLALAEILGFCPVISPLYQPHKYSEVTGCDFFSSPFQCTICIRVSF